MRIMGILVQDEEQKAFYEEMFKEKGLLAASVRITDKGDSNNLPTLLTSTESVIGKERINHILNTWNRNTRTGEFKIYPGA